MTTFERRQRILSILRKEPGIKVNELARVLDVSEGTIRNDLRALDQSNQLVRVRGGAVIKDSHQFSNQSFGERVLINSAAKELIGRRAADLVNDGDSILMDASTTVFHVAPHLVNLQNLTIITNGIEVALYLSKNPSFTVILLGGVLRTDGTSVIGHLGEKLLRDLHIGTAFVSCSGFSLETGLTESDIQEVQLKSKMVQSADRVVALIDSSKFGKVGLSSFARLDQVHQIYSDAGVDPGTIQQVCAAGISFSVCGDTTISTFASSCGEVNRYKIGFANLCEDQMPFAVDVRRGLEQAAKQAGNIDLILADNRLDKEIALKVADDLIAANVDLAIEYQIDERTGNSIFSKYKNAGIPVISVDIPMVGATFFGVDNYQAGYLAGSALGRWIQQEWKGKYDRVIVLEEQRAGALPAARIHGQLDGLGEIVGDVPAAKIIHIESGNTSEESEIQMTKTLQDLPGKHRLAVICFNDDAAFGALAAASKLKREHDVVIIGQGADRRVRSELRRPGSRIIGSTAYWPERYGEKLIDAALRILKGEPVSPAVYIDHTLITPENIDQFYPEEQKP